jgi:hypothetical protein
LAEPNRTDANRFWIAIAKTAGKADRFLHLDIFPSHGGCRLKYGTSGAIRGHNAAASAFSVASKSALWRDSTLRASDLSPSNPTVGRDSALYYDGAFMGGPNEHVKFSSSEGPRRMFFDPNGHPYNPPLVLQKPDVTAADGVTVDVWDYPFFGTSAAAPEVAGIAALMWSKDPSLTAEDIKKALRKSAIQIGDKKGWDSTSGFGIINAEAALRATDTVKSQKGPQISSRDTNSEEAPRATETVRTSGARGAWRRLKHNRGRTLSE